MNVNQIARESFFIGEQYRQYLLNKQIEGQTSLAQETSPDGQLQKRKELKKYFFTFNIRFVFSLSGCYAFKFKLERVLSCTLPFGATSRAEKSDAQCSNKHF